MFAYNHICILYYRSNNVLDADRNTKYTHNIEPRLQ